MLYSFEQEDRSHLPEGIIAEEADWTAFFFIKAPADMGHLQLRLINLDMRVTLTLGMLRFVRNTGSRDSECG